MSIRKFKDKQPRIGNAVYIDDSAIIIGDVTLGNDVSIWPTTVLRGDVESITIGDGTNIQEGSVLHTTHAHHDSEPSYPVTVGKGVTIGHKAVIHACTIGDYCLIGMGSIIMDGAVIEDYVILGAGSLVPHSKRLESGHLYVGSPARRVRPLNDAEKEFLHYSYKHYIELKNDYLTLDN
ncbi:MAG: gamma carbonic anhydrase family protein [Methylococcales bacterium]|nr:gamma carbonic anhydrase family protein [Methylococcales bacterium]